VVDETFGMRAAAGADLIEQFHRAFLEQSGADAAEHVIGGVTLQDDVVDAIGMKKLPKQQSCRTRSNDCYFRPQCLVPSAIVGLLPLQSPRGAAGLQ
jgi:hypothetical protein